VGAITSLQPAALPVDPGGVSVATLTVRNTGTVVDEFAIEVIGDAAGWATAEPASISLFPGAEGTATITFRPPRAPSTRSGQLRVGVMARSKEDPAGSIVAEATLEVSPFLEPTAELVPRTSHGSRTGRHDLALDNRGNTRLEAALEGIDPDRLVRFDIDPPNLAVDPGTAGFAKIAVKPVKTFLRGPAKSRQFQLAIRPDAPNASPILLDGSYLQESILPWWFVRALIAAIALLVALVLLWILVLQPNIKSTAAETLVDFGFSPKPGSPAGGGGGGGGGGASPGPAPSGAIVVTPPPDGGVTQVDGRLATTNNAVIPKTGTLSITDLVFSNPSGASGDLTLQRTTPSGTTQLMVLRLENFRDLDFHFVTPITVRIDETLALVANCTSSPTAPAAACTPAVFYSGYIQAAP
jgi:hypothetical protein